MKYLYIYNKVKAEVWMKRWLLCAAFFILHSSLFTLKAQDKIVNPDISYAGTPRTCIIGGITAKGVDEYEEFTLTGLSGLSVGQEIDVPGNEITEAVKRYWRHGLFSRVQITADSLVGSKIYLCIHLALRPRVSTINYNGLKKSEREDMEAKLGIMKGSQITPNMIDRAKILAKKYFDSKGYKNAEIEIMQRDDVTGGKNQVILDVNVDKKAKMKVRNIVLQGNENLKDSKIKGSLFGKGAFGKIHEAGKFSQMFKAKKFTDERYKEAKEALVDKYNELGYRDMAIIEDSVWNEDEKHVNVLVKVEEGQKYYIRNITWVGNTVATTDYLSRLLGMEKGDVYNQRLMSKRLSEDEDAVGNYYWNNGYLFYRLDPTEVNIVGDSIDLEMRIFEGQQAYLNHVRIYGNDRLYEEVVRRELRTKPGDLFSKEALTRSVRDIASMGHFDQEKVNPDVKPNGEDGTVDINWQLEQKSNDQIEFSLGWGQTGVIGRVGLKLNNFSMRNLFGKNKMHRGIMPIGDGEQLGINFQTNGSYYSQISTSYSTNWFGNKRPTSFSVSLFYSKQSDISSYYRNNSLYNSLYGYGYGYGYGYYNNYAYNYESMLDDDKNIRMFGASIGWGKRLRWPDDFFQFMATVGYTRYMLQDWNYFYISNGNCNNLNLGLTLSRTSTDNQLFPRKGSEFMLSLAVTPPWSLFDGKDYKNLALNSNSATYESELQDMYRWIEYHKWKFKTRTFTALTGGQKCFVLMTRAEVGILGSFNSDKKSPFETFYVGGDGMSGYSYSYAEETIGLRGYDNGSISTSSAYTESTGRRTSNNAYAYDRFTLELRYPFMLGNTTIYGLTFLEGGNAWADVKKFNPFNMKKSAGVGVRIFLPMVGLMGIDWAYGFDKVYTSSGWSKGGSQFHFVLGQEF